MRRYDRHQPVRILERHQTADVRVVAAESAHQIEERRVLQRDRKRLPARLRDTTIEHRRIAELRPALRQLFPQSPNAAVCLGELGGGMVIAPKLEASFIEPFCMKTRSSSFTAITSSLPLRRQWMSVTTNSPLSIV